MIETNSVSQSAQPAASNGGNSRERIIRPAQHDNQVSFVWSPGTAIAELICRPGYEDNLRFLFWEKASGTVTQRESIGELRPLPWLKDFARARAVRLPSAVAEYGTVDELAQRVRSFIHRYADCDPIFESVIVLFVLHTWLYERFGSVPNLRLGPGDPETGKSRITFTAGALCYHPLSLVGAMTPAPMYRLIEAVGGTMLIDEADFRDTEIGAEIVKVLTSGYHQNGFVMRMEKDEQGKFVPKLYSVFGPKIINGRQRFKDDAVETRCLSYVPQPTTRTDIPRQLPDAFHKEALELQNQLLKFRFDYFDSLQPSMELVGEVSARMNEIILPLLTVCSLMSPQTRGRYRQDLLRFAREANQLKRDLKAESVEATLVQKLAGFVASGTSNPTCKELCDEVQYAEAKNRPDLKLSPERVGHMVRAMGLKTKHTKQGSVVLATPKQLRALCQRYGIEAHAGPAKSNGQGQTNPHQTVTETITQGD